MDRKRILVVDDDDAIRSLLVELLTDAGYVVGEARSGRDGLARVAERRPDLILLDKLMADGDGTFFAREYAAKRGQHAPIVGLCAARGAEEWAREVGLAALVTKPFDIDELLVTVTRQLGSSLDRDLGRAPDSALGSRSEESA